MSALLAVYDDSLCAGPVALENCVVVRQLTILKGSLDSFSFGCLNVGVYLSSS